MQTIEIRVKGLRVRATGWLAVIGATLVAVTFVAVVLAR